MAALLLVIPMGLPFILCEQMPPPVNLTVQALNTNYTLHWTWAGMDTQSAKFTIQYIGKFRLTQNQSNWVTACEDTQTMSCDLNPLNLHYLGIFALRVRATVNGYHSEWAQVDFAPATDAAVGPPIRVLVSPAGNVLEVSISAPQTVTSTSMKEKIHSLYYRILYWEHHASHKKSQAAAVDSANTMVVLEDLKSWTWYCVSVQSRTIEPNRTSAFTDPICISTQGEFQWGKFSWIFGISLLLGFIIVLGILLGCFYNKKRFQTSVTQPACLNEQHWHSPHQLLSSDQQSEQCDLLTVKSSSWDHVHSSGRPDWQSCSDSQDSGIYSTNDKTTSEQSTNLQNEGQHNVQDTCLTPKIVTLIQDEGFSEESQRAEPSD